MSRFPRIQVRGANARVVMRVALACACALAGATHGAAPALADAVPVGSVVAYGGSTLPSGWLWADGSAVSRATYAQLFAATGTTYGAGNGTTTFNVPDMRQRFALGRAASGTGSTLGGTGGAIDHSHSATLAAHSHSATLASHAHALNAFAPHSHTWVGSGTNPPDGSFYGTYFVQNMTTSSVCAGGCAAGGVTSSANGAGTFASTAATQTASSVAANPPFLALDHIVKASTTAIAPCGALYLQARSVLPTSAIAADGAARSRSTSGDLFGCTGTTFGAGDGSTTFNVADLRQRFALGRAASGTGDVAGTTGGAIDHAPSFTVSSTTHQFNLDHAHDATAPNHQHSPNAPATNFRNSGAIYGFWGMGYLDGLTTSDGAATVTGSTAGGAAAASSSSGAHAASSTSANAPFLALRGIVYDAPADGYSVTTGTVVPFAGSTPPAGWVIADGRALDRTVFADLFARLGTTYGAGDGSTTFNVPDLRQRMALGQAAGGTGSALGSTGGAIDHVHTTTIAAHTHTLTPPAHSHSFSYPNHSHLVTQNGMPGGWYLENTCCGSGNVMLNYGPIATSAAGAQVVNAVANASAPVTTTSAGGQVVGSSAANAPYLVVNYIIAVDVDSPSATPTAPADGAMFTTPPTLGADYLDPNDGSSGSIEFRICPDAACTSTAASGSSAGSIAPGGSGSWGPGALADGTWYWMARSVDAGGNVGAWSGARSFELGAAGVLTVNLSTLGHADGARDTSAPFAVGMATALPGSATEIGPAGSGQALAGPALAITVGSTGTYDVLGSVADWTGPSAMSASVLSWRQHGSATAWAAFAPTDTTLEGSGMAGTTTFEYDLKATVPPAQRAGTYTTTMSITAVAPP